MIGMAVALNYGFGLGHPREIPAILCVRWLARFAEIQRKYWRRKDFRAAACTRFDANAGQVPRSGDEENRYILVAEKEYKYIRVGFVVGGRC